MAVCCRVERRGVVVVVVEVGVLIVSGCLRQLGLCGRKSKILAGSSEREESEREESHLDKVPKERKGGLTRLRRSLFPS